MSGPATQAQLHQDQTDRQFETVREDISDIKGTLNKIADAVGRLAVLEDRQMNTTAVSAKMLERLERMEDRQRTAEVATSGYDRMIILVEGIDKRVKEVEVAQIKSDTSIKAYTRAVQIIWTILGSGLLIGGGKLLSMIMAA